MASGYYDITNKTLGKGHYGVVKLGRHCLTGEPVAIKIIEKSRLNPDSLNQLGTEIRILFRLSEYEHPNILKLYQTIDTEEKLFLITEYCGPHACDLHDYLSRKHCRDGLAEQKAQVFFIQICSAISYCHSMGIVHRDLKPENILVTDYKHMHTRTNTNETPRDPHYPLLKLIDFGFANQWYPEEKMRTSCGTLAYSAPELLLGEPYDGTKVDVWGLGLMLYILIYGGNPFMQINDNETLTKILDCSFATPKRDNVDQNAIELLRSLIKRDPNTRLPIDAILRHKWFASIPKTFELLLSYQANPVDIQQPSTVVNNNNNNNNNNNVVSSTNLTKSLTKTAAQVVSSTTLPSISESGPLKNINRSADDEQSISDSISEISKPSYNRTRSLSITRTYIRTNQQTSLSHTRSSNNLERLNHTPRAISLNTSPKQQFTPLGSPMCRPTSPDVRGSVEPTEEESRLHDKVLKEIFRLTKLIDSKSSVEASLKNARFSHRQFDQNSIKPTQFGRRRLSTGLVSLLSHDNKEGHELIVSSPPPGSGDHVPDKPDGKSCIISTKLSNDDYIYATYQLTRDRILRFKQDKLRRQKSDDLNCNLQECTTSSDTIPEEELGCKEQDNELPELNHQDRVSAKENEITRLQQRKLLQPQHRMRDKFTSFFRSGSTSPSGSFSLPYEPNASGDGNLELHHHDAFNDQNNEMSSSVARFFGSSTDQSENSMAYALPLARKCSLVSEESCPNEHPDNQ